MKFAVEKNEMSDENFSNIDTEEEQDLYEHYKFVADPQQQPLRIDKFLLDRLHNTSRNRIQNAIKAGNVLVNQSTVKANYKVKPHDEISIVLPYPKRHLRIHPENIPLNIVYEDEHIVVINKQAGLVAHPGYSNFTGTLVNALLYHFGNLPSRDKEEPKPGLVHRLDKDTTGLMVIAKSELALNKLSKMFFDRTVERRYYALVWGDLETDGTIEGNIARNKSDRRIMDVYPEGETGKFARTHYKVIERLHYVTLVECKLDTGRTHQIRVHFKHIGHPLFGDVQYGGDKILKGTTFSKYKQFVQNCFKILPRQALHAKTLSFTHPATDKPMHFDSPLPEDFEQVLLKWKNYVQFNQ